MPLNDLIFFSVIIILISLTLLMIFISISLRKKSHRLEIQVKVLAMANVNISELYVDLEASKNLLEQKTQSLAKANVNIAYLYAEIEEQKEILEKQKATLHLQNSKLEETNQSLKKAYEDLKLAQDQLFNAEKMAALGQLVAGIAHEVNTPLGAINASSTNLKEYMQKFLDFSNKILPTMNQEKMNLLIHSLDKAYKNDVTLTSAEERKIKNQTTEYLDKLKIEDSSGVAELLVSSNTFDQIDAILPLIKEDITTLRFIDTFMGLKRSTSIITLAVTRVSKIIFALKNYSRSENNVLNKVNIADGIDNIIILYSNLIKQGIEIIKEYEPVPQVIGYEDELIQVWTNLIYNSIQSMKNKGKITIKLYSKDNYVVGSIIDSGPGIPDEIKGKLFTPFFTTKPRGEGTGLGLCLVKKFIEKHKGYIKIISGPTGTNFMVYLPLDPREATAKESNNIVTWAKDVNEL